LIGDSQLLWAMGKGRFLNQKLGKRVSRKYGLLRTQLAGQRPPHAVKPDDVRLPKKGASREEKPRG
jgi:hypothetical protein